MLARCKQEGEEEGRKEGEENEEEGEERRGTYPSVARIVEVVRERVVEAFKHKRAGQHKHRRGARPPKHGLVEYLAKRHGNRSGEK